MAIVEFKLEEKGLNAAAQKFRGWYVVGLKENGGTYDAVFSRVLSGGSSGNGQIVFSSMEFEMSPGDKVDLIVINSTNMTGTGMLGVASMMPKTESLTVGDFPYGGLLRITSINITVATG